MRKNLLSPHLVSTSFGRLVSRVLFLGILFLIIISLPSNGQAKLIKDLGTEAGYYGYNHNLIAAGNLFYFIHDNGLYKSSGKPGTTDLVIRRSAVGGITYSNNIVFFIALDDADNWALWKTNGTAAGTVKLKSFASRWLPGPGELIDINGTLFFVATTTSHGRELWKSNGTITGTVMVRDIRRGMGDSEPHSLTYLRGRLFFSADDGIHGRELWSSDGTYGGTTLFKDIRPGTGLGSDASALVNVKGTLYFSASDGVRGKELWKSNGTPGATVLVKDIHPGPEGSDIENTTDVNGLLLFSANDGVHGDELWKSNGSAAGTTLVKDLNPGPDGSNNPDPFRSQIGSFKNVNGILYFVASKDSDDFIYRSNGTASGTFVIQQAYTFNAAPVDPAFESIGDYVYFFNGTGYGFEDKYIFWKMHYKGVRPAALKEFDYQEGIDQELLRFKGALYFFLRPNILFDGSRLMVSDGTTRGTRVLEDPRLSSGPAEMVAVNDLVYIRTYPNTGDHGQLYRTDGTAGGTFAYGIMREHEQMVAIGNKLFFTALDGYGSGLYVTEGTLESTRKLLPGNVGGTIASALTEVGGSLFYVSYEDGLWRTDGTPGDQIYLGDVIPPLRMYEVNGQAFMLIAQEFGGLELWRSTPTGPPVYVKTINESYYFDYTVPIPTFKTATIDNIFYFVVGDGVHGEEIWRSDGTEPGTYMMFNIRTLDETGESEEDEDDIRGLTAYNNQLFFSAQSDDGSWNWYQATGDHAYAELVSMPPVIHTVVHKDLIHILAAFPGESEQIQLWVSDGTSAGTRLMSEFPGGGPADHAIVGDVLYLSTRDGMYPIRSDGTECGTFIINTGVEHAFPMEPLRRNLVFGGYTPSTGMEPFIYNSINSVLPPSGCEEATASLAVRTSDILTPYPNPFGSDFTIRVNSTDPNPVSVSVFTTTGFPVESFSNLKSNTDYPHIGVRWPPGMYVIKVHALGRISTHLVVKR